MANNDSTKRVPLELLCMLILKEGDRYGRRTAVGVQNVLKSCEVQHEKEA